MIIQMNGNLSLTMTVTSNKTSFKADAALDGSPMESSVCRNTDTPIMNISLNKGSGLPGQITYRFTKGPDSEVSMCITYIVTPDDVFKNNDKMPQSFTIEKSIKLSNDNSSFTCTASQKLKFNPGNSSGVIYDFKMHISQIHIQAFNIKNGTFSPAEDCTDSGVSTEGPTTEQPTQPPTTQPLTTQPHQKNDTTTEAQVTTIMQTSEAPKTSEVIPTEGQTTEPLTTTQPPSPTTQNDKTTEASETTKMQTSEASKTSEVTTTFTTTEPPTTIVTTVVPTTTMVPEPTPKPGSPDTNTYTVDSGSTTCLVLKAGIEFTVPYVATGGADKTVVVGIPKGFTVNGNCTGTNTTQSLLVSFYNNQWTLTMIFATSDTKFYMSEVDLNARLDSSVIKDINKTVQVKINKMFENGQFSALKTGSYKCSAKITLTLDNNGFAMNTYNLQYAAFQTFSKNTTDFTDNNISDCSGDTTTNSVVPIAVGAALAGLVVIVLIAYLIGRRRRRAAGYEKTF